MLRPLLTTLALLFASGSATALTVGVAPIAFFGDAASGVPGATYSALFGEVNGAGEVAVSGSLAGGGQGIWSWDVAAGGTPSSTMVVAVPTGN